MGGLRVAVPCRFWQSDSKDLHRSSPSLLCRLQGIETVRRDNCELVRNMVATCLDKILIERDEAGAIEYVKGIIRDLLMNKVDMSLLVVTKVGEHDWYTARSAESFRSCTIGSCCSGAGDLAVQGNVGDDCLLLQNTVE